MPKVNKGVVRPGVTWTLVMAQCGLALAWAIGSWGSAAEAFKALAPFTMMTQVYWFKARDEEKREQGD